jgi:hypothetical protein
MEKEKPDMNEQIRIYESVVLRNECPDCHSKLSQRGVTLECTHCDASFLCSELQIRRVEKISGNLYRLSPK